MWKHVGRRNTWQYNTTDSSSQYVYSLLRTACNVVSRLKVAMSSVDLRRQRESLLYLDLNHYDISLTGISSAHHDIYMQ